jgi:hypothetical protein
MKEYKEHKNDGSETHKIYDINQIINHFRIGVKTPSQKIIVKRRDEKSCDSANLIAEVMGAKCFYGGKK